MNQVQQLKRIRVSWMGFRKGSDLLPVLILLCLCFFKSFVVFSAEHTPASGRTLDSLLTAILRQKDDSSKVNTQLLVGQEFLQKTNLTEAEKAAGSARDLAISLHYKRGIADALSLLGSVNTLRGDYTKALELHIQALKLRQESGDRKGIATSLNNIGNVHYNRGNYQIAIENYSEALQIREAIGDDKGISACQLNLANIYKYQGDYPRALELYFKSLKLKESIGDKKGIPNLLNNIGTIYSDQSDTAKALEYYERALKMARETDNKKDITHSLNNIGNLCSASGNYAQALDRYMEALQIRQEAKDKRGVAVCLNNLGLIYAKQGNDQKAMEYFTNSLKLKEELQDKQGIVSSLIGQETVFAKQGKYTEALDCAERGLALARELGALELIRDAEKALSEIYLGKKDELKSLVHYRAYIHARDSLLSTESARKSIRAEMNFAFEKRQAVEHAASGKREALALAEKNKEKIQLFFVCCALALVLVFAVFAIVHYLRKQKLNGALDLRNKEIEGAYKIIESKNRKITDSISYASRIQHSILPKKETIRNFFPKSLLLYKPKDIVSGDFFFFSNGRQDNPGNPLPHSRKIFIAAADCTGHGVPGAFMSMIGVEKLHETLAHEDHAGEVLALLNRGIKTSLRQNGSDHATRDGMDIAFCAFDPETLLLQYAGANRPLWIFRNNVGQLEEIKATHAAIGGHTNDKQVFGMHEIQLFPGDRFYLLTDGYADQFGGNQGKKLTTKTLKEMMRDMQHKSMPDQELHLNEFANTWKSNREQIDDILIIGIEV